MATKPGAIVHPSGHRGLGLRARLFLSFGISAALTAAALGWVGYYFARSQLQRQLEARLRTAAATMSAQIHPSYAAALQPGDEEAEITVSLRQRLERLRVAADVRRAFVL